MSDGRTLCASRVIPLTLMSLFATVVAAQTPEFSVQVNSVSFDAQDLDLQDAGDGRFITVGDTVQESWNFAWALAVSNPTIGGTFSIVNTTMDDQRFDVSFNLPVEAPLASTQQSGFLDFTVSDASGDATATIADFTWVGLIDGSDALALATIPSAGCNFAAGCEASFIAETLSAPGPALTSSIGIDISFVLSAGDRIDFDTTYEVAAVPLPAGLPMLLGALGTLGASAVRRRRRC
ncbi:MAG: VPLPA-CTERM sorting domain-containing protein [Pseudomonadota bacterium]